MSVYRKIINHSKLIFIVFIGMAIACIFLQSTIVVDYDIDDYLPENSASTVAIDKLKEEFSSDIPNARVMLNHVNIAQALECKAQIEALEGVSEVTWLDDFVAIEQPLEMVDQNLVEEYYKDGNALFTITIDEDKRIEEVHAIREIIGEDNAMTGSAISTAVATESTTIEVALIASMSVIFVFFVLLLTTTSWVEPFVILIGLGTAILINAGSNVIFGEISFVTNAAGNILQLAVSLDYSVFLLHRFTECRKKTSDAKEAMVEALSASTSSILSSGLTTVIGFLALCLMQFEIGPDLGRALAKGVAISLITVFVFMPVLILATYKWIDRFEHKPFLPSFEKLGKIVSRVMIPMVILFSVVILPAFLASHANSYRYGASDIFGVETQLGKDTHAIEEQFGKNDTYVLMVKNDAKATQKELSEELQKNPEITSILSYVDTVGAEIPESYLSKEQYELLCADDYTRMVISVDTDYEGEDTFALVKTIRDTAQTYYPNQWYLAGEGVSTYDLMDTITEDMVKVNLMAIGAVLLVLILTMHSITLPIILVLGIETAIWLNLSIPYFQDAPIFYIAYLIISSVQLGATVDYAILFSERYKEYRQMMLKKEAIIQTVSMVTTSILTSGIVLTVVGFLLGMISTNGLLAQLGFFLGKGTLFSLGIVLFVLPGLLYLLDRTFIKKNKGVQKNEKKTR